jgi:excisionase family DNA binding protein
MDFQELAKSNESANIQIVVSLKDLNAYSSNLIEKAKKELEASVLSDKAEIYLTVNQVAEILNVDLSTLWRWNKKGYLKTIEIGGSRRYKMSAVKAMLNGKG